MQLIAGLGNPGEKYQDNPHNIGFRTLDQLMKALDLEGFQRRFNSEFQRTLENVAKRLQNAQDTSRFLQKKFL